MVYKSIIADMLEQFVYYRKASGSWSETYADNLRYFDNYCSTEYPYADSFTQEMVDSWCKKRDTEKNNSCRSRINDKCNDIRDI